MTDILTLTSSSPAASSGGIASAGPSSPQPADASFSQVLAGQRPAATPAESRADAVQPAQAGRRPAPAGQEGSERSRREDDETAGAEGAAALAGGLLAQQALEIAVQVAAHRRGHVGETNRHGAATDAPAQRPGERRAQADGPHAAGSPGAEATRAAVAAAQAMAQAGAAAMPPAMEPAVLPGTAASMADPRNADPRARLRDSSIQVASGSIGQALADPRAAAQVRKRAAIEPGGADTPRIAAPVAAMSAPPLASATPAGATRAEDSRTSLLADLAAGAPAAHAAPPALASQGSSAPMVASVAPPVGSAAWAPELGRQVVVLSQAADGAPQTAELRLDPPDLGPLRITLTVQDGVAHAVFASAHAAVRNAVESALPTLAQSLAEAGISLGQANVNDQEQPGREGPGFAAGGSRHGQAAGGADSGQAASPTATVARSDPRSLVDTFA